MSNTPSSSGHRVAIIGGGFGGLYAARRLRGSRLITGQPLLPDIEEPEPPA